MSMLESKLLSALANLGNAAGSELVSNGVLSAPDELVKAFEEAMQGIDMSMNQEANNASTNQDSSLSSNDNDILKGPAEEVPSLNLDNQQVEVDGLNHAQQIENSTEAQNIDWQNSSSSSQDFTFDRSQQAQVNQHENIANISNDNKVQTGELGHELQAILEKLAQPGANLSHLELYRAQYIMGMLKTQAQTGMKISQGISQGLESALKQNG